MSLGEASKIPHKKALDPRIVHCIPPIGAGQKGLRLDIGEDVRADELSAETRSRPARGKGERFHRERDTDKENKHDRGDLLPGSK